MGRTEKRNHAVTEKRMWFSFWCVLLASVMVITICGVYMAEMVSRQQEEMESRITVAALQNRDFMAQRLSSDFRTLQSIALLLEQKVSVDLETFIPYLRSVAKKNTFDQIGYVDRDGIGYQIDSNSEDVCWIDLSQTDSFHQSLMNISEMEVLYDGQNRFYRISVPVSRDGETDGAVFMATSADRLADMISSYPLGTGAFSCIVEDDGRILFSSNQVTEEWKMPDSLSGLQIQVEQLMEVLQTKESTPVECEMNGEDYLACLLPMGVKRWYLLCLVPQSQIVGEMSVIQISLIAGGCTALLLLLLFLYYFVMIRRSYGDIRKLAYFDRLTGAYNRDYFQMKAAEILRQEEGSYALFLIDLQNFKFINELFGVSGGNELLLYIKRTLEKSVCPGEIYFRDMADRFGALIAYEEYGELRVRIHRLLDEISDYSFEDGEQCYISCRCGVCLLEADGVEHIDVNREINHALIALQEAKECENNRVIFYNEWLYRKSERRHAIETKMENALKNRQFQVYFQPKFSLPDRRIGGAEALVRWMDEDGEMLYSPEEFIPIMEQNGFIAQLDRYVLRETCRIMDGWRKQGLEICPVSVNQSRRLLYQADYVGALREILKEWDVPPEKVILEITESVAMEDTELLKRVVDELHRAGFLVSMDDFGSGYSSLNILKDLPVDELKLDRVFFEKTDRLNRQKTVIRSVIMLARNLRIKTVAEGVENAEQEKFLCRIGCNMAQSFYFSGCMSAERFTKLLMKEQNL